MRPEEHGEVRFNTTGASIAGSISGVALAAAVPWVLLKYGAALGPSMQTILVTVAVIMGGLMGLMSAFFGLVMPNQVHGYDHGHERHEQPKAQAAAAEKPS